MSRQHEHFLYSKFIQSLNEYTDIYKVYCTTYINAIHLHANDLFKKGQVGNDQEKAQSDRNSTPKTEAGKNKLTIRNDQ